MDPFLNARVTTNKCHNNHLNAMVTLHISTAPLGQTVEMCRVTIAFRWLLQYSPSDYTLRNIFPQFTNLVPRASFPLTSGRKTRALGATISGMRHRCRCAVSRITRIRLFPLFFHNGCSQSSRFLPQARRIVGSGDEIGNLLVSVSMRDWPRLGKEWIPEGVVGR